MVEATTANCKLQEQIGMECLPLLSENDLQTLGVASAEHRALIAASISMQAQHMCAPQDLLPSDITNDQMEHRGICPVRNRPALEGTAIRIQPI
jgi:hypothetical protein